MWSGFAPDATVLSTGGIRSVSDYLHAVWTDQLLALLHFGALLVSVLLRTWQRA
jgi:hypothetical protein